MTFKNRVLKLGLVFLCAGLFIFPTTQAFAHSGRTDSSGGHNDNINGGYHYHHGMGPHDHPGGVCPYSASPENKEKKSTKAKKKAKAKKKSQEKVSEEEKEVEVSGELDTQEPVAESPVEANSNSPEDSNSSESGEDLDFSEACSSCGAIFFFLVIIGGVIAVKK